MKHTLTLCNKGFVLMTTLLVGTVLTVLSGAYLASSLSQNTIAKRQFESNQEFYGGEAGIAYGYVEAKGGITTHSIVSGNLLQKNTTSSALKVSGSSLDSGDGSYSPSGGRVKVKIFKRGDDIIVLSRALDSHGELTGPVHRFLISYKSLYKYFQFYDDGSVFPGGYNWYTGGSGQIYAGKLVKTANNTYMRVGGIHVNGNIQLGSVTLTNLSELSCSRQIYYYNWVRNTEPAYYDFQTWEPVNKKMILNYSKSTLSECKVDGFAPIPRFSDAPYNFKYPLTYDPLRITAVPFKEGDGIWRNTFMHPNLLIYGYDVTDDWGASGATVKEYGWMRLKIDTNSNGAIDTNEDIRIPKILPDCYGSGPPGYNSACLYDWDKYNDSPGDNYTGGYKLISPAPSPLPTEPPVRFQVTNSDYKNEALLWLANKEDTANPSVDSSNNSEYSYYTSTTITNWLTAAAVKGYSVSANNRWDWYEYDRVTLLSLEEEGPDGLGLSLGGGKGLHRDSEYEIYKAIKNFMSVPSVPLPGTLHSSVRNWIEGPTFSDFDSSSLDLRDDFFAWWRQRSYHHKEALGSPGGSFSSDTATVPAWERIFWEAWLNYWPPVHSKAHNQIYLPAEYRHALNPEWWEDLVYGNDRPTSGADLNLSLPYLNTNDPEQADIFAAWLSSKGLYNQDEPRESVVKFDAPTSSTDTVSHQGEYLQPLNIKVAYSSKAYDEGLYIKQTGAAEINSFEVKMNGSELFSGTLSYCLISLGLDSVISIKKFYNPYTITKGTYKPGDSVDACKQIYGTKCESINKDGLAAPPYVSAITIDVAQLKASGITLNNPVIYIESVDYDTLLVNGYSLPAGGLTVVSPYNVYIKAEKKSEQDVGGNADFNFNGSKGTESASYGGLFNYENADKTSLVDADSETNYQPAAVITNSRVYLLSSEFAIGDSAPTVFPYSYNFPDWSSSLRNNYFLQNYCYDNWPTDDTSTSAPSDFPVKPGVRSDLTWSWIIGADLTPQAPRLNNPQQKQLLDAGNSKYVSDFSTNLVNRVLYNQFYNVAIASPFEPRGYRIERWVDASGNMVKAYQEGAFIKIGYWKNSDGAFVPTRYHSPGDTIVNWYERTRFRIPAGYEYMADDYKVQENGSEKVNYEYEERYWLPGGTPAGDFLATGYEQKWDQLNPDVDGRDSFAYDILPSS